MSPRVAYIEKNFKVETLAIIDAANQIIDEYLAEGYQLTLRQLYYQFVARDLIENTQRSYKRLGSVINDGRMAGRIDWEAIEDRTRNLESLPHWRSPGHVVRAVANQFNIDRWASQEVRVEVWIEKEALAGVFERVCDEEDVPFFCCRGYTSQSEMWSAARRLARYSMQGQTPVILHFGDHDPSGIDMTRDIRERLNLFGAPLQVRRLALNMAQVDEFDPPPNPAKVTDSRFEGYLLEYGAESWELDALEPSVLADLVRSNVESLRDEALWDEATEEQEEGRRLLGEAADRWHEVVETLEAHDG